MAETNTQAKAWNFNKSNTHQWVFFKFFKLYKWFPDHAKHIFPRVLKRIFSLKGFFLKKKKTCEGPSSKIVCSINSFMKEAVII